MDYVDTHCHIISADVASYPRAPLGGTQSAWASTRPVDADGLIEAMDDADVAQSVLVQATTAYGYDNSYVVDSWAARPDRFVAVGTFDPLRPDSANALESAVTEGGLAGVRLFTTGSTMPGQGEWFAAPETKDFWQRAQDLDVPVCLQMRLGAATAELESVLGSFPRVRVLLDHAGYPDIAGSPADAGRELARLARHASLHLKVTHRILEPLHDAGSEAMAFLEPVIDAFGGERLAWGSNFPAATQSLAELVALAEDVLAPVAEEIRSAIFSGTARSLYPGLAREASA